MGGETAVSDAAMAADIIQHSWGAMAAQVLRVCTHDAAHSTHGDRHERRILEMGDPDSDIDALLDKVHDAIDEQHICADLRVAAQEIAENRSEIAPPK